MPFAIDDFLQRHRLHRRLFVAYSGGVDSHVLLHACAGLAGCRGRLTAVHVHHGLQPQASDWARHCRQVAAALGVGFVSLEVEAAANRGQSPEEAAREARYQALKPLLADGDGLLLAQHQQDQLETVLLQLFRGAGLPGLAGMPERAAFGAGWLLRPLLSVPKAAIDAYANEHGLRWVEDPSNQSCAFDRNFLRQAVLPLLGGRWPGLAKTVARSARHCADAQALLDEQARLWLDEVYDHQHRALDVGKLLALEAPRRAWVIRRWFARLGLRMPSQAQVRQLHSQLLAARPDANPLLAGTGYCLRRYRGRLYCLPPAPAGQWAARRWDISQRCLQLDGQHRLCWSEAGQGIALPVWRRATVEVRRRDGGERIRLPGRQGCHSLKKLYQEAGVPPWLRAAMPLVYLDGRLAAVADLWVDAEFFHQGQAGACASLKLWTGDGQPGDARA